MARLKTTRLLLVLFSLFTAFSLASPTALASTKRSDTSDLDCSSKFSGDYYGLGVRLGIYFTWITSWLANTFVEEEIAGALDANAIFLFALLISIVKGSVPDEDQLAYIDGLILMEFCAGYLFGNFSMWGYRTSHYYKKGPKAIRHYGRIGTHCRLILTTAISIYGIWFWTYGINYNAHHGLHRVTDDQGNPRPPQCYPVYVFFFAKLNVLGGIRIFYILSTVGTTLYYGTMLLAAVAERIRHLVQLLRTEKGNHKRQTLNYQTGLTRKELNFLFKFQCVFNLIWIVFTIVKVELAVIWNHVKGVLGPNGNIDYPAQLLPLLIGLLGFVRILWLMFKEWRWPEDESGEEEAVQPTSTMSPGDVPGTPGVGLGLLSPQTPHSEAPTAVNGEDYDHSIVARRSLATRYLVAYLPWLSQFEFWKNPKGHQSLQSSLEKDGKPYRDSPLMATQTSYKSDEDVDVRVRSYASATTAASPMIDMKSPTSVNAFQP